MKDYKYLVANGQRMNPITYAYLETTNYCNLDCSFCNRKDVIGPLKHMSLEDWSKLLNGIKHHPIEEVKLMGMGEPLLHPHFDHVCRMFKETFPKSKLVVATNCQYNIKEGLEFSEKDYDEIDNYAKAVGMDWFASAWDYESQNFLSKYNLSVNKVASAMATNQEILELVAGERKLTYLSTGMCDLPQIDNAVAVFKSFDCPFVLMHSVAEYPAPESALNLRCILTLKERYECRVGYSGHESSVSPSIVAATLGACAIERHITLDRAMYGSDQSASLEPHGIETLVSQVRKISVVMGDGKKRISNGERINEKKLRYWL